VDAQRQVSIAESLSKAGVKLAPDIVAAAGGGSLVSALLGAMLHDRVAPKSREDGTKPRRNPRSRSDVTQGCGPRSITV